MSGYITGMTVAEPLDGGELVEISQLSPTVRISAATISADEDDNSFNDSAAGFIAAGFAEGDRVNVTGFANALNNLFFGVISSLTASKMIIAGPEGDFIVDAAASPTITIAKWTTRRATAQDIANLGGGGGGIAGIDVLENGVAVQLDATVLNFTGAGVTVTDDGGYEVEVNIPGGGGGGFAETISEAGSSANLLNSNAGKYQRWTGTGAKTLNVQPNSTEAISTDAEFLIRNAATSGDLTIAAGSGVTINAPAGGTLVMQPGMTATLKRVSVDAFDLIGQTVAA